LKVYIKVFFISCHWYTAISIKVVHEQSGKVEYERERLLGIANKLMNFQSGSQQPFALVFDLPLCSWTTLIEIAVSKASAQWQ
jgi:hypothetical protein